MLVSLDMKLLRQSGTFQMRWYPYFSIYLMLVLMFVIPHDPSSSLDPNQVGGQAYHLGARVPKVTHRWSKIGGATPGLNAPPQPQPHGHAALTLPPHLLLDDAHESSADDVSAHVLRLVRLARQRPALMLRIAAANLRSAPAAAAAPAPPNTANGTSLGWSTEVEELRAAYGARQSWWGDLTPAETRALYHALLPTSLLSDGNEYTLAERAELAVAARRAARLYARERALLPYVFGCELLDGMRQMLKGGAFQKEGYSEAQIWLKYAGMLPSELPEGSAFHEDVYTTILQKACSTNEQVDKLCGCVGDAAADAAAWSSDIGV